MDWNDMAVWTVIAALIAGVAGIVGALIRDAITISGKIGKLDNTTLSGQHKNIQESVDRSATSIQKSVDRSTIDIQTLVGRSASDIQKSVDKSNNALGQIQSHLMQEKTAQDWRDKNMDASQQEIKSSFDKIQGLVKDWQDVNVENARLREENKTLDAQNAELKAEMQELSESILELSDKNKELQQDNDRLSHKRKPQQRERN